MYCTEVLYPSVSKVLARSVRVSVIHRTPTMGYRIFNVKHTVITNEHALGPAQTRTCACMLRVDVSTEIELFVVDPLVDRVEQMAPDQATFRHQTWRQRKARARPRADNSPLPSAHVLDVT